MGYDVCATDESPDIDPNEVLDRLSSRFGESSIRSLTERFAATLNDALRALDAGDAVAIAHRVAGVAGTLGFAAVSTGWLALAERRGDNLDLLRHDSAEALMLIAARYGSLPQA